MASITFQAYATNSGAYKANKPMPAGSPVGIVVHSTGVDNPNLKRYVNAPDICGENPYKNYFDRPNNDVVPHGVIGLDKNGEVKAAKILPWDICCWGCGNGSKGSYNYNPAYIQVEICEDDLTDEKYFMECFKLMAKLCNRLMKHYPTIKLGNIVSHHEAHLRGYASGHVDCDHWLAKFDKDMNWFRELVKNNGEVEKYLKEYDKPRVNTPYRIRKSKDNAESQIGAYNDLETAKNIADYNRGYKVFDSLGNLVYKPSVYYAKYTITKDKTPIKYIPERNAKTIAKFPKDTEITVYLGSNVTAENGTIWVKFTSPECEKFPNKFAYVPFQYIKSLKG